MTFEEIIKNPFVWGLLLGLLIAAFILKNAIGSKIQLKREIKKLEKETRELQSHLNTQMKITATGSDSLTKEVDRLKEQNETLRVNLASLQSKPDKNEQRQFRMQEMAISTMREQAPGFAGAWEKAMRQAEADMESAESGFSKLVRKVVPGLSYSGTRAPASETQVIENQSEPS
jgi:predicted  nucleic acid-binding Zn-ribbon protein